MNNLNNVVVLSIEELLSKIYEYQRHHDIREQCITNTQFMYNYIKTHYPNTQLKTVAVLVVVDKSINERAICCNHILLKINDELIEPSYEYSKYTNRIYYYNYEDFFLTVYGKCYEREYSKTKYINEYLKMVKLSTQINITTNPTKYINYSYYNELTAYLNN